MDSWGNISHSLPATAKIYLDILYEYLVKRTASAVSLCCVVLEMRALQMLLRGCDAHGVADGCVHDSVPGNSALESSS